MQHKKADVKETDYREKGKLTLKASSKKDPSESHGGRVCQCQRVRHGILEIYIYIYIYIYMYKKGGIQRRGGERKEMKRRKAQL